MRSLKNINKNHPEKKKSGPAVKKESHKSHVSLAEKKKTENKKVVGKVEPQPKKKSAPIIKGKPAKNPVLPAAVKKQPAKGKPAGKEAQQSKKKETPIIKTKPSKNPVLSAPVKEQPAKGKPAGKAAQQNKKKDVPIIKTKPSKNPVLPAAVKKQPVKGKPAGKVAQGEKKAAPVVKEKTFEAKVVSSEMDQLSEGKEVILAEEIQTQNEMVSPIDLGKRYKCYKCGIKFYDLGKPQPLCPSCGANQLDGVIKATRKRRGKQRSAFAAKTEPQNIAPDENEDLHEVVDALDNEFVLDMDDIVLEEHEDTEDKE
jgi:hypothetical protein